MNEQEKIPINYFINLILPYKFFIVGSLALFLGLAWVYLQTQPNYYKVDAEMMLSLNRGEGVDEEFLKEIGAFNTIGEKEDEIGYMESYNFVKRTVERLDAGISYYQKKWLAEIPKPGKYNPFLIKIDSTHNQLAYVPIFVAPAGDDKIIVRIEENEGWMYDAAETELADKASDIYLEKVIRSGEFVETPYVRFQVILNDKYPFNSDFEYFFKVNPLADQVKQYRARLNIKLKKAESNILQLSTTGPIIAQEEDFLNLVMDTYIQDKLDSKNKGGRNTLDFIDEQIERTNDSLRRKEAELARIQAEGGVLNTEAVSITKNSDITRLMSQKADLDVKINYIKYIQKNLDDDNTTIPAPSTNDIQDPLLRSLILELSRLKQEKASMTNETVNSPRMKRINTEIASVRASLKESVNNNLSNYQSQRSGVNRQLISLNAQVRDLPGIQSRINKVDREVQLIKETYNYLIKKRTDAALAVAKQERKNLILDEARAQSTEPVSPNKMLIFGLAFVFGLALPIAFVIAKEVFQTKVTGQRDIDLMTDIPTLGFVIHNDSSSLRITSETQNTAFAECFRSLRVQIKYFRNKGTKQLVGFTSTWPNEGKSFCAANYAAVMALSGKKTLLVDLDLRSPSLQDYYLFGKGPGLTEYLQGSADDWKSLLRNSDIDTLKLLPAGSITFKPLDLLEGDRFANMLDEMRKQYDVIILDTPPIGQTADYNIVKEFLDFTSYVVRYKKTDKESLKQINMLYDTGIVTNIGLIINGVTEAFFNKYGEKGTYYGQYIGREYV